MPTGLSMYKQLNTLRTHPYPSVPIRTDRHALKWQLELAAADTLQSAPSESTPQALHKPRKRRTLHTTLVAVRRHTLQLIRPEIHSAAIGAGFV